MANYALDAVLFEREAGCWVGQCLQYDLGAQADTLPALIHEMRKVLASHVVISLDNEEEPFEGLDRAPEEYWRRWSGDGFFLEVEETAMFRMPSQRSVPKPRFKIAA